MTRGQIYEFGGFRLDSADRLLYRQDQVIHLAPKVIDTLLVLLERQGHVVEKDELLRRVWPDACVEEGSLAQNISLLRRTLGDDRNGNQIIATVPKRGYRFVWPVTVREQDDALAESPGREGLPVGTAWRRVGWLAALALVLAAAVLVWQSRQPGQPASEGKVMLAVLPFENLSGDPEQDYFADGLTEEMISQLGQLNPGRLAVIARTSAMKYKGTRKGVAEIGRELGVQYVLEGSVRREGERFRVTAQLVRTGDQTQTWSANFDRPQGDLLALQSEMARAVSRDIHIRITSQYEARLVARRPVDPEVYQLYLKGRYFWNKRTREGLGKAISYFQQAIDRDTNYALAYAGLADSYILKRVFALLQPGETLQQMEREARVAAERALEIDGNLAEAHTSLGLIKALTENDEAGVEREYRRAIELNPNYVTAHHWYALYLSAAGRFDEAKAEIKRALEIDPVSLVINSDVGIVFFVGRQYDEAIEHFQKAIELDPNYPDAHAMLGWVLVQKRMYPEAIAEFEKARTLFGSPTKPLEGLIYAYSMSGDRKQALRLLGQLKRLTQEQRTEISWLQWVFIHVGLGENDKAFEALEKALAKGLDIKPFLNSPQAEPLHSDPRFAELRRRVGLR